MARLQQDGFVSRIGHAAAEMTLRDNVRAYMIVSDDLLVNMDGCYTFPH